MTTGSKSSDSHSTRTVERSAQDEPKRAEALGGEELHDGDTVTVRFRVKSTKDDEVTLEPVDMPGKEEKRPEYKVKASAARKTERAPG